MQINVASFLINGGLDIFIDFQPTPRVLYLSLHERAASTSFMLHGECEKTELPWKYAQH